jgi:hypothetical protein
MKPINRTTEAEIEAYLRKKVKEVLCGRAFKWISPGNTGVPDRIIIMRHARIAFVELKAPGKTPTPIQLAMHAILKHFGFEVKVIDTKPGVDAFIQHHLTIQRYLEAREFSE